MSNSQYIVNAAVPSCLSFLQGNLPGLTPTVRMPHPWQSHRDGWDAKLRQLRPR
jgi:hypothetical protein